MNVKWKCCLMYNIGFWLGARRTSRRQKRQWISSEFWLGIEVDGGSPAKIESAIKIHTEKTQKRYRILVKEIVGGSRKVDKGRRKEEGGLEHLSWLIYWHLFKWNKEWYELYVMCKMYIRWIELNIWWCTTRIDCAVIEIRWYSLHHQIYTATANRKDAFQ